MRDQVLLVEEFGCYVGKHSERVQVKQKDKMLTEMPVMNLDQILILSGGVSLSSDAIRVCAENGIPITLLSRGGKVYARVVSAEMGGTVRTRREQLLAYLDTRGVHLAKAFASGKMLNQAILLKYISKYRKQTDVEVFSAARVAAAQITALVEQVRALTCENLRGGVGNWSSLSSGAAPIDELRPQLLNLEGRAAAIYWEAIKKLLIGDGSPRSPQVLEFQGREGRGSTELVNAALNYGYGVLYSQIDQAIVLAGLDPYGGFVHVDRAGKPSLVLDLVEEFRQPVVDRTVFALLNKGVELKQDDDGKFTDKARRLLADKVLERLEGEEPYEGKRHKLRTIIQMQARHVATFVRGEGNYHAFVGRW